MSAVVCPELFLLIRLAGKIYKMPPLRPINSKFNLPKFLRIASNNNVLGYVLDGIEQGTTSRREEDAYLLCLKEAVNRKIAKFRNTIDCLNKVLGEDSYLVLKALREQLIPFNDLDILVKDLNQAGRLLEDSGFKVYEQEKYVKGYSKQGYLRISMYGKIAWRSKICVGERFAWMNPRRMEMFGILITVPSVETDILTLIAHSAFETFQITFNDFLCVCQLARQADWKSIKREVTRNGWYDLFIETIGVLNGLHFEIYGEPSPITEFIRYTKPVRLELPYIFPLSVIVSSLAHKRITRLLKLPFYLPSYVPVRLNLKHPILASVCIKTALLLRKCLKPYFRVST